MSVPGPRAPKAKLAGSEGGFLRVLRSASLVVLAVGAIGSLLMMFLVGHHNNSRLLLLMFAIWVLSPFAVLAVAPAFMFRRPAAKTLIYVLMLVVAVGSVAIYAGVLLGPPRAQPAFMFIVVPLASWILIALVLLALRWVSARTSRGAGGSATREGA